MYHKKHRIRSSYLFISLLAGICWILALTEVLFQLSDATVNAENVVPAYSSHAPVYADSEYRFHAVSEHTYEMTSPDVSTTNNKIPASDMLSDNSLVQSTFASLLHDSALQLIFSHTEKNYADFYLYSPKLEKLGYNKASFGQNLHVAVTKNGHIYLASPQIDYDF